MLLLTGIKPSIDSLHLTDKSRMLRCRHGGKSPERHPTKGGGIGIFLTDYLGYDMDGVKPICSWKGGK
jgi:hypothetical protein